MANIVEKHIFFIDDEQRIREVVKETLKHSNFKVSCFDDPIECLAQLHSKKCELLITDLKMPKKDGIELLMDVQRIAPWVPVLIITGFGNIPTAVKAIRAGAVDFIEKPLVKTDLIRRIELILKNNLYSHPHLGTPLTRTERKILQIVMDGKSNQEIATILNRSVRTVEVHRTHIMRKLGVGNLVDLVKRVTTMKLVDIEEKHPPDEDKPNSENDEQITS